LVCRRSWPHQCNVSFSFLFSRYSDVIYWKTLSPVYLFGVIVALCIHSDTISRREMRVSFQKIIFEYFKPVVAVLISFECGSQQFFSWMTFVQHEKRKRVVLCCDFHQVSGNKKRRETESLRVNIEPASSI
jgi:hypothetical protein